VVTGSGQLHRYSIFSGWKLKLSCLGPHLKFHLLDRISKLAGNACGMCVLRVKNGQIWTYACKCTERTPGVVLPPSGRLQIFASTPLVLFAERTLEPHLAGETPGHPPLGDFGLTSHHHSQSHSVIQPYSATLPNVAARAAAE
jgi:hypothetical protein